MTTPKPTHLDAKARDLVLDDVIVNKDGSHTLVCDVRRTHDGTVRIVTDQGRFEVDLTYPVRVLPRGCWKCSGNGLHYGKGETHNGVFTGVVGTCYGCNGKGWNDVADTYRNRTYWAKYARIYA